LATLGMKKMVSYPIYLIYHSYKQMDLEFFNFNLAAFYWTYRTQMLSLL
jgi:hypothetical protein